MLTGLYVANVTPFRADGEHSLDVVAYCEHVHWLADKGITGVVPFGTNGEGPSVATSEKASTLDALIAADMGVRLIPTVAETNLPDTVALLKYLNTLDIEAVLVLPPYFFKPVDPQGLRWFFERVLEVSRHPVVAYHIPKYAVPVPAGLVTSLPLWGVKDSDGKPEYADAVRSAGQGVLLGTEDDLPGRLPHVEGAISALANVVPEQVIELHRRVLSGDEAGAGRLSSHLKQVRSMTKEYASPGVLKVLAQARHGLPMGTVRPPLAPVPDTFDVAAALDRLQMPS